MSPSTEWRRTVLGRVRTLLTAAYPLRDKGSSTMIARIADLPLVFAQDGPNAGIWQLLVYLLPMIAVVYFLMIMPQQQQEKKRRAMIDGLKKNDKVLTTGGIYGTVMSVDAKNDRVVLRVDDERGVKLAVTTASVGRVIESSSEKSAEGA